MRAVLIIAAIAIGFAIEISCARWAARRSQAYHDKIYNECIASHELPWYCDTLAWRAARAKYD